MRILKNVCTKCHFHLIPISENILHIPQHLTVDIYQAKISIESDRLSLSQSIIWNETADYFLNYSQLESIGGITWRPP